jgi:hypothetical protein
VNIYITLDYELFFGSKSGTVEACIIEPTKALLDIVDPLGIKLTLFVDAGYLMALKRQRSEYAALQQDYEKISRQMKTLSTAGHNLQLHIHPHWEDSYYKEGHWEFNTSRYKLADFSEEEVLRIVTNYHDHIKEITNLPCTSYRAGGWSAQPFEAIGKALAANGIFIDSTVFPGGYYESAQQQYDFKNVPSFTTHYTFSTDLTQIDAKGNFAEIPISAHRVSPIFFWRFVFIKLFGGSKHKAFGDGNAISKEGNDVFRLLTRYSNSVVSMDGFKASYLNSAFKAYNKQKATALNFVIIGHPKAFTPYSLQKLKHFINKTHTNHSYRAM